MAKPREVDFRIVHENMGERSFSSSFLAWIVLIVLGWGWICGFTVDGAHYHVGCEYPAGFTITTKTLPH